MITRSKSSLCGSAGDNGDAKSTLGLHARMGWTWQLSGSLLTLMNNKRYDTWCATNKWSVRDSKRPLKNTTYRSSTAITMNAIVTISYAIIVLGVWETRLDRSSWGSVILCPKPTRLYENTIPPMHLALKVNMTRVEKRLVLLAKL